MKRGTFKTQEGSTFLAVLFIVVLLTVLAGGAMVNISNRRLTLNQANAWQQALIAAEAGVHDALAQVEKKLNENQPFISGTYTLSPDLVLSHAGEGPLSTTTSYTITAWINPGYGNSGVSRPFFKIRSTGTVQIPGSKSLSKDPRDAILRKLKLLSSPPSVSRTVEAWLKPRLNTDGAFMVDGLINLNNLTIGIDGFNSADPNRSFNAALTPTGTALGYFDLPPVSGLTPIYLANLATNSQIIDASNATIYGDALTNGGIVTGTSGIQGTLRTDYYQPLAKVYAPSWASTTAATGGGNNRSTFTTLRSSDTLYGGTKNNPAQYSVSAVDLRGLNDTLRFSTGVGSTQTDPKTYVELYVAGNLSTMGGTDTSGTYGAIYIDPGMNVTIWVKGDITLTGKGLTNNTQQASTLSIYGVTPTDGSTQTWMIAGNSIFYGSIYAPSADLTLAGGANGIFVGSITGKTMLLKGNVLVRYDEALSLYGMVIGYKIVSWFEDTK